MASNKKMILSSLSKFDDEIFKLLPGQIYWKDKEGFYLGCNQEQAKYLGFYSCEDIIGKTDYDLQPQKTADEFRRNDLKVMKKGSPTTIVEDDFLSTKIPLHNEKNEVVGIFGMSISFKNYKNIIENNGKMLDKIIGNIPGHVYWKDKNCILMGCNEQQAIDVGLKSRHEIVGKSAYDIINKKLPENIRREQANITDTADKEIMASGIPKIFEESVILLDGTEAIYLSQKTPLYDDNGELVGLLGISVDITDRKQLESKLLSATELAEAANQLKTEFIQNMQHDIRTPISGIYSLLDTTNKTSNFSEFKKALPYAYKSAKELLDICNEVIDFESVEYGLKPVYTRKFSLLELLHSTINLNGAAALVHKSTLELKVDHGVPDVIKGDDYRLKKILINLIGNAVKFTENGKITLCVNAIANKDKQTTIRFKVIDTGIGIAEDKLHTIFEKFTRLNPSNTGKFKGSGFGLYLVKKFTEEMDAELDVKSTPGKGTVFTVDVTFDLPKVNQLADEDEHHELSRHLLIDASLPETEKIESISPTIKAPLDTTIADDMKDAVRVLLIEDDNLAMMAVEHIFSNEVARRCHISKAINKAQALQVLKENHFDAVVSDLGLPDGTGNEIAIEVKKDSSHINYNTPFIALTAHSDDAKRAMAKDAGFFAIYNKPLSKEQGNKILSEYVPDRKNQGIVEAVDLPLAIEIAGGKEETAIQLLSMLVSSFATEKKLFEDAFKSNDFKRARELFHKFRGGLGYVRTPEVEKIAATLHSEVKELEEKKGNLESLSLHLHALFRAVEAVSEWLNNYKASKNL